jgi:uncharacterized RmlC-like cupin family protein
VDAQSFEVTCRVVCSGEAYEGKQGLTYLRGLTGETVGSRGISMTVLTLPDGARAKTHLHHGVETAVYVIAGRAEMFFGPALEEHLDCSAGDYVYIPADVPHLVTNRSGAETTALVAHTAAGDQEGIVLLPELDALIPA